MFPHEAMIPTFYVVDTRFTPNKLQLAVVVVVVVVVIIVVVVVVGVGVGVRATILCTTTSNIIRVALYSMLE